VSDQRPEVRASADDELAEAFEMRDSAQADINRLMPELNDLKEQVRVTLSAGKQSLVIVTWFDFLIMCFLFT
jgi:hypothetical protein